MCHPEAAECCDLFSFYMQQRSLEGGQKGTRRVQNSYKKVAVMHITKSGSNAYHKSGSNAYHKVAVMHIRSNKYGGTTRRREDE
jgi:hypothetical protein